MKPPVPPPRARLAGSVRGLRASLIVVLVAGLLGGWPPPSRGENVPLSFVLDRFDDNGGDYPIRFYSFRSGSKRYTFCPPPAWTVGGEGTTMLFSARSAAGDAVARFKISNAEELALLGPEGQTRREASLRKYLPVGCKDVRQEGAENTNPAPVLGRRGSEYVYEFEFYGRKLKASVMICQLDEKNGFSLTATAPAEAWNDFAAQLRHTLGAADVADAR